mmetsp:Transcript_45851/g.131415  ORF Transcript_45851/g.131415 Transcript_45851/m.131415 type:complete len:189 (+) Transcript_45851:1419-1985(+)
MKRASARPSTRASPEAPGPVAAVLCFGHVSTRDTSFTHWLCNFVTASGLFVPFGLEIIGLSLNSIGRHRRLRPPSPTSLLARLGWRWVDVRTIVGPYDFDDDLHHIDLFGDRPCLAHHIRQIWRHYLARHSRPRNDMGGICAGIHFDFTRRLYTAGGHSYYEKGMLRSILLGALWTPGCLPPLPYFRH